MTLRAGGFPLSLVFTTFAETAETDLPVALLVAVGAAPVAAWGEGLVCRGMGQPAVLASQTKGERGEMVQTELPESRFSAR